MGRGGSKRIRLGQMTTGYVSRGNGSGVLWAAAAVVWISRPKGVTSHRPSNRFANILQPDIGAEKLSGDFNTRCAALGEPVCFDAASVGAGAHRLRNYWTNLGSSRTMEGLISLMGRPDDAVEASDVLERSSVRTSRRGGAAMSHTANPDGYQPPLCFPDQGPGMVLDSNGGRVDLTAEERERLMGHPAGLTAATGLNLKQRVRLTGGAFDAYTLRALLVAGLAAAEQQASVLTCLHAVWQGGGETETIWANGGLTRAELSRKIWANGGLTRAELSRKNSGGMTRGQFPPRLTSPMPAEQMKPCIWSWC